MSGEGWTINLVGCTDVILQVVGERHATRKYVALTYAMALKSQAAGADKPDWQIINQAILTRWKRSGLEYIKQRALDILSGKVTVGSKS